MEAVTAATILRVAKAKGWPVPVATGKPYDLFVFGVRCGPAGKFDDLIGVVYANDRGELVLEHWRATTDPGIPWLVSPMNPDGCAAIAEGRHPLVWTVGLHKGKPALVQCGVFRVKRDNDRDTVLEIDDREARDVTGAGLNLHEMGDGPDSRDVGRWSAGCQGTENPAGVRRIVALAKEQSRRYGWNRVSYHLFGAADFPGVDLFANAA